MNSKKDDTAYFFIQLIQEKRPYFPKNVYFESKAAE